MLRRRREIAAREGGFSIQTPLLVPSFSSKGFTRRGIYSLPSLFENAVGILSEGCLVSAYDIGVGNLSLTDLSRLNVKFCILDSGGYEMDAAFQFSEARRFDFVPAAWCKCKHIKVLQAWPQNQRAIFVGYDEPTEGKTLFDQINDAKYILYETQPVNLRCFLIKRLYGSQDLLEVIDSIPAYANELNEFDIVGVTEKELASNASGRMIQIARLRKCLDNAGIAAPIHVFGSLDPVSVCLYSIAGAEIFDGLSWLRFAFSEDDRCLYRHQYEVASFGLDFDSSEYNIQSEFMSLLNNLSYLETLQDRLRRFISTGDYSLLPEPNLMKKAVKHVADF